MFRRFRAAVMTATFVASGVTLTATPASADPVPAPYSGSTHGDILSLDVQVLADLLGIAGVTANVAHSATAVDSEGTPRSHAESANVDVGALGLGVGLVEAAADAPPSSTYDESLLQVDTPPLLDTALLTGTGQASWAGDAACVTPGTPIAQSTTTTAGATVADLSALAGLLAPLGTVLGDLTDLNLAELGVASTTGTVQLEPNGATNDVVATTTATLAATTLLGGRGEVTVESPVVLTATSDGTTGTATYSNPIVGVSLDLDGDGTDELVTADLAADGGTLNATVDLASVTDPILGTVLGGLAADVTVSLLGFQDLSTGATGEGVLDAVLSLKISLSATGVVAGLLGADLASVSLGLLPLSAIATAPEGGVECTVPVVEPPAQEPPAEEPAAPQPGDAPNDPVPPKKATLPAVGVDDRLGLLALLALGLMTGGAVLVGVGLRPPLRRGTGPSTA
jgi:hypothetical protein